MDKKRGMIIWEHDAVWAEGLRLRLKDRQIICEEIDTKEDLAERLRDGTSAAVCILSEKTVLESGLSFQRCMDFFWNCGSTYVVLLLEKDDTEVEIGAFKLGAAEVLVKERGMDLAVERLMALARHIWKPSEEIGEQEFLECQFTKMEKKVLYELYKNQGKVVTRKELVDAFWIERKREDNRVVDTVIKQLRKKIKGTSFRIKSIYGQGYYLKKI